MSTTVIDAGITELGASEFVISSGRLQLTASNQIRGGTLTLAGHEYHQQRGCHEHVRQSLAHR
ncbi:MAG: hypothetical protein WDM96_08540 [Lacunisphaera sp.]